MSHAFDSIDKPIILLGAGGHGRVLLELLVLNGYSLQGVCDPRLVNVGISCWQSIPVLGDDSYLDQVYPNTVALVIGVGQMPGDKNRENVFKRWYTRGFSFVSVIHPTSWVSDSIDIGEGVQVMAGAVIQPGCSIADNTIVNTMASVDHDCKIGANVHIAPGVTLCGNVTIGHGSFIGAGTTIIQGVSVGEGTVVGAGKTIIGDLLP